MLVVSRLPNRDDLRQGTVAALVFRALSRVAFDPLRFRFPESMDTA
jgi:hypothetical protein